MTMLLLARWWYGPGFAWVFRGLLLRRLHYIAEVFSVKEMITTLFAPFRQTFVGKRHGVSALQAFADRSVARIIGFVVRSLLIIVAGIGCVVVGVVGIVLVLSWPLIPFLPLIAGVLAVLRVGAS